MEEGRFSSSNRTREILSRARREKSTITIIIKEWEIFARIEDKENQSPSKDEKMEEGYKDERRTILLTPSNRTREILPHAKREKPTITIIIKE